MKFTVSQALQMIKIAYEGKFIRFEHEEIFRVSSNEGTINALVSILSSRVWISEDGLEIGAIRDTIEDYEFALPQKIRNEILDKDVVQQLDKEEKIKIDDLHVTSPRRLSPEKKEKKQRKEKKKNKHNKAQKPSMLNFPNLESTYSIEQIALKRDMMVADRLPSLKIDSHTWAGLCKKLLTATEPLNKYDARIYIIWHILMTELLGAFKAISLQDSMKVPDAHKIHSIFLTFTKQLYQCDPDSAFLIHFYIFFIHLTFQYKLAAVKKVRASSAQIKSEIALYFPNASESLLLHEEEESTLKQVIAENVATAMGNVLLNGLGLSGKILKGKTLRNNVAEYKTMAKALSIVLCYEDDFFRNPPQHELYQTNHHLQKKYQSELDALMKIMFKQISKSSFQLSAVEFVTSPVFKEHTLAPKGQGDQGIQVELYSKLSSLAVSLNQSGAPLSPKSGLRIAKGSEMQVSPPASPKKGSFIQKPQTPERKDSDAKKTESGSYIRKPASPKGSATKNLIVQPSMQDQQDNVLFISRESSGEQTPKSIFHSIPLIVGLSSSTENEWELVPVSFLDHSEPAYPDLINMYDLRVHACWRIFLLQLKEMCLRLRSSENQEFQDVNPIKLHTLFVQFICKLTQLNQFGTAQEFHNLFHSSFCEMTEHKQKKEVSAKTEQSIASELSNQLYVRLKLVDNLVTDEDNAREKEFNFLVKIFSNFLRSHPGLFIEKYSKELYESVVYANENDYKIELETLVKLLWTHFSDIQLDLQDVGVHSSKSTDISQFTERFVVDMDMSSDEEVLKKRETDKDSNAPTIPRFIRRVSDALLGKSTQKGATVLDKEVEVLTHNYLPLAQGNFPPAPTTPPPVPLNRADYIALQQLPLPPAPPPSSPSFKLYIPNSKEGRTSSGQWYVPTLKQKDKEDLPSPKRGFKPGE